MGVDGVGAAFWIVNPDLLTIRIQQAEGMGLSDANLAAVQRLETWLHVADIYNNSGLSPKRVGGKSGGMIDLAPDAPANLVRALAPLLE